MEEGCLSEEKECHVCKVGVPLRIIKEICLKAGSTPSKCEEAFGKVVLGESTVDEYYRDVKSLIPPDDKGAHVTVDSAKMALDELDDSEFD